jgi:hypothetical protein
MSKGRRQRFTGMLMKGTLDVRQEDRDLPEESK